MSDLPQLPFPRRHPLQVPQEYRELRATGPVTLVRTQAGDEAWLVTGYEEVRALLADPRLGRSHPAPETAARVSGSVLLGGPSGDFATERADHEMMRKLVAPAFSARRMQALAGHVQELVDGLLDEMAGKTPPLDLHAHFSLPLPALVICELLGVPYQDRDLFQSLADGMTDVLDPVAASAAKDELCAYIGTLLERKRENPAEDLFSDLATMDAPREQVAMLGAALLFAGHETTVNRIDLGVLLLLGDRPQWDALAADPARAPAAVEEILRVASPSDHGLVRYAKEDLEFGGVTIRRGDAVVVSPTAANRDERIFDRPDEFDTTRRPEDPHIAFGYARHYCVGASLARVELRSAFATLPRRFPTLELAVPLEALPRRTGRLTGGFSEVPVTW
ncbi:cytochrome P450 [Sphaerisporangium rubeum]|uniref:Pentalenolactone synthase n=1 Tax=Sphaerisporangium rubeum TaxID=321317 RepID=A0A7X0I8P7_9ACTN|nr:pentalenolactone synthase [Sphaerisporangium rubeum]